MKKLTSLCLALSALFLGSCNKDDGPGTDYTDQVKAVTGVYKGDLTVSLAGTAMPAQTQKIQVTANAAGTAVKLEIKNFSFSGLTIGDLVLDEVPAAYENGKVVLKEKQATLAIEGLGDVDVALTEGAVSGSNFAVKLSIYQQEADLQIGVSFDGVKMTEADNDAEQIKAVTGVYKGDLTVSLAGTAMPAQTQKIYVTANEAGTAAKLEIKNFSFSGLTIGDIVLDGVPAAYEDGKVVLQEKQTTLTFEGLGDVDVTLTEGAVSGDDFTMELSIYQPSADLQIGVSFDGTKMAEDQSSEALLTGFTVTGSEAVIGTEINADAKTITVRVNTLEGVKISPEITVSEGAAVEPASGTEIDLSQPVEYTVTSQDGTVRNTYRVVAVKGALATFDVWSKAEATQEWQQYPIPGEAGWTSSNEALTLVKLMNRLDKDGNYSVMPADDARSGKAAMVQTFDTKGMAPILSFPAIPKVTAGSLFTGTFDMTAATGDPLSGTLFGQPVDFQPKAVTGYYKYTPGATFYRCDDPAKSNVAVEDASQADKMSIKVVLYEVSDPSETLTGHTLNTTDPKVIARGEFISGETVSEYTPFTITLNYTGTYDASKSYKLAVVCSSSYLGDQFSGAPGSTLWLDDVEIQGM